MKLLINWLCIQVRLSFFLLFPPSEPRGSVKRVAAPITCNGIASISATVLHDRLMRLVRKGLKINFGRRHARGAEDGLFWVLFSTPIMVAELTQRSLGWEEGSDGLKRLHLQMEP